VGVGWIIIYTMFCQGKTIKNQHAKDCIYYNPISANTTKEGFYTYGDRQKCIEFYRDLLAGSSGLAALAAFACAGALITPLTWEGANPEPGIIHLGGLGGRGKTSALRLLAGMAGTPDPPRTIGSLIRTWRTTENGLEAPLERANDAFCSWMK
jgi:uncharacterized protein (DUF927 family)